MSNILAVIQTIANTLGSFTTEIVGLVERLSVIKDEFMSGYLCWLPTDYITEIKLLFASIIALRIVGRI